MNRLRDLAERWSREPGAPSVDPMPRLWVGQTPDGLFVDYFGAPFEDGFGALLDALAAPEIAVDLVGVTLRGPDEGANGTCNWNLQPFVDRAAALPRLRTFTVEQGRSADHNTHVIAEEYEEGGVLGRRCRRPSSASFTRSSRR